MSRQLRVRFPGAIYHATSRGDRRQAIVVDDRDRDAFFQRIGTTVEKYRWQMFAVVLMTNHFHLFFSAQQIVQTVCDVLHVDPVVLSTRGSRHAARALVAYLNRYATDTTLRQIAEQLGLSRPDSVPSQIRRITRSAPNSEIRRQLTLVEAALGVSPTSIGSPYRP